MGYFSNGTEGMMYEEEYCYNCANYEKKPYEQFPEEGGSCPIMDAHYAGNYDQHSKSKYSKSLREVLDTLIPRRADGFNDICSMFTPKPEDTVKSDYFREVLAKGKPTLGQWAFEIEKGV